jgi:hypothetical protein
MIMQALYKQIALLSFVLFLITKSQAQSLPITSYGVWDRGGGIPDYSDPNADFVKGIETSASWEDIQPNGPTSWDFSAFQTRLDVAVANDKLIRFSINVGPDCPLWVFDNGVPLVNVISNAPKNDSYANRNPYYPDPEYKAYYFEMIRQFALFLRNQPQEKFDHIAFVQVKTGATGDEEPYKGDVINPIYDLTLAQWEAFRLESFAKFKENFNDVSTRKIVLTFNNVDPVDEPDAYDFVMNEIDPVLGFGLKGGAYNRGHHLSDEQSYKEQWNPFLINPKVGPGNPNGVKLFSASEMDQSWDKGYFALNYEIGFYWSALGGINTGLSCTNISVSAMTYALANPGIIDIFKMYNRYAQQVYPATATTAFSVFHEGLNSADKVKFPVSTYGTATRTNLARYQNICNDPKYANRGARIDDTVAVVKGQVYQREDQEFYNDAGWDICEGNIERFMTQINPDDTSIGLFRVRGPITATSSKYDRFARSFENSTGKNTMYFQLHNEFPASNKILKFTIIWLDKTAGSTWAFKYRNAAGLQTIAYTGTGTNEWRTETFNISDAVMNQGGVNGSDFMLVNTDTTDDIFNGIEMNILGISKQNQTINFNALPLKMVGDADFSAGATASSGLTVSYTSSNSDVATIVNGNIHIVGGGISTITASQAGDANYNVATPVTQDITVNKLDQSITFNSLPSKTVGDADFSPGATASSGLAVSYTSSNTAAATIVNGNIHIVGGGSSIITASQAGNSSYNAATSVTQNLAVPAINQTTITTSGTWTCPEGVTSIQVEAWGGGGSGGTATTGGIGGGGAGGAYVINNNVAVVPNSSYTITIGSGGIASTTASTTGTTAGSTTFPSTTPVIALGGVLGSNALGSGTLGSGGSNGTNPTNGGSGGTVSLGSAGTAGSAGSGGAGGAGANGGGAGGASDTTTSVNTPGIGGNNGTAPGGGGSGALGSGSGSRVGGTGGAGQIKITYTVGVPNAPTIGTATVLGASGEASIPFTAPSFNGNATIIFYTATSSPGGLTGTLNQAGSGVITVSGLSSGIAYTFTVTATNSEGQSAASGTSNTVTPTIVSNGSGSWNSTTTWAEGVVPRENDYVRIFGSHTVSVAVTGAICNNLTIDSGASISLNSGSLTVKNTLLNNGSLTIENNANLIQTATGLDTNSGSGSAIVKRNSNPLKRLDYTLWSSPVSGSQTLAQFSPLTSQSPSRFYSYIPSTGLYSSISEPLNTTFDKGKGYLIRMPNNADALNPTAYQGEFTGTLNNGTIPVPVTTGYNLVGNPYPSNISLSSLISNNSSLLDATAYFWRKTNAAVVSSAYCTYNNSSSTYASNDQTGAATLFDGTIKSGQGFFVNATVAGNLNFTNSQRTGVTTNQAFFKTRQVTAAEKLWLNATNTAGDFSQMAVTYSAGATTGLDDFDSKFINDSGYALTSNIEGGEYTIQGRPAFDVTDVVDLNFKTDVAGDYTITLDHFDGLFTTGQDVYLVDSKTGTETNLKTSSYIFNATAGVDNTRFSLKYQKTLKVDAPAFNENSVRVYKNNSTLYVNSGNVAISNIAVFDIQGRLIAEQKNVKATTATIHNLKAINQVLIVKIIAENNQEVIKKILN